MLLFIYCHTRARMHHRKLPDFSVKVIDQQNMLRHPRLLTSTCACRNRLLSERPICVSVLHATSTTCRHHQIDRAGILAFLINNQDRNLKQFRSNAADGAPTVPTVSVSWRENAPFTAYMKFTDICNSLYLLLFLRILHVAPASESILLSNSLL